MRRLRLVWRTPDPAAAVADLARRLGAEESPAGALTLGFLHGPSIPVVAGEEPYDRLVSDPAVPDERDDDGPTLALPHALAAVAVATVVLPDDATTGVREEPALGARGVVTDVDGLPVVVLEPATEGRLAASLARFGPGPCGLYLRPAERRPDVVAGPPIAGVVGLARLVTGLPSWGPHLLLLEHDEPSPSTTIGP